jgi:hypothetical protein
MKRGGKTLICFFCAGAMTTGVKALVNDVEQGNPARGGDSPYSAIWLRNVFDLKPPPPTTTTPAQTTAPSNVQLTGITTMLGTKRVLISVTAGKAGKPESYMMREGERQGGLEILEINPKAGTVKINLDGLESTITFSTNAAPAGAAGGPPPMVGGAGTMRPPVLPGSPVPGFNATGVPLNNGFAPPARQIRTPDYQAAPQSGYVQPAQPAVYGGYVQPGTTAGLNLGNLLTQAPPAPGMITPMPDVPPMDQQIAELVQQHQIHANDSMSMILPPIPGMALPSPTPAAPTPPAEDSVAPPSPPAFTPQLPSWLRARATGTLNQGQ